MPLVNCPACKGQVDNLARTCPRCGRAGPFGTVSGPLAYLIKGSMAAIILVLLAAAALIIAVRVMRP